MHGTDWAFFTALTKEFPQKKPIFNALPKEEQTELLEVTTPSISARELLFEPLRWYSSMHPSWFEEELDKMPLAIQSIIKELVVKGPAEQLLFKEQFALNYLFKHWKNHPIINKRSIPQNPFLTLLNEPLKNLLVLIKLLALSTFVDQIKKTVQKQTLQAILDSLSPIEKRFLSLMYRQKTHAVQETITLQKLVEKKSMFKKFLQRKGLKILGKAISLSPKEFIEALIHTFDKQRGTYLRTVIIETEKNEVKDLQDQVLQIMQFLTTGKL